MSDHCWIRQTGSGFISQPTWFLDFRLTESVSWKWFVLVVYQFWKDISAGPALRYFTWFIGVGGCDLYSNKSASDALRRRLIGFRIHPCHLVIVDRHMFPLTRVHCLIPGGWSYGFFGLHAGWVHSDSVVVSDYQGVGGVSDVCISVHCTHSACQKQWSWTASEWRNFKSPWIQFTQHNTNANTNVGCRSKTCQVGRLCLFLFFFPWVVKTQSIT